MYLQYTLVYGVESSSKRRVFLTWQMSRRPSLDLPTLACLTRLQVDLCSHLRRDTDICAASQTKGIRFSIYMRSCRAAHPRSGLEVRAWAVDTALHGRQRVVMQVPSHWCQVLAWRAAIIAAHHAAPASPASLEKRSSKSVGRQTLPKRVVGCSTQGLFRFV